MGAFALCSLPEPWEIECSAQFVLQLACQDGADKPDVEEALKDLGFLVIRVAVAEKRGWTDFDQLIVYCRPSPDPRDETWTLAHELAHVAQELEGLPSEFHDEIITDQIARSILMPEGSFRKIVKGLGPDNPGILEEYRHVDPVQVLARTIELGF